MFRGCFSGLHLPPIARSRGRADHVRCARSAQSGAATRSASATCRCCFQACRSRAAAPPRLSRLPSRRARRRRVKRVLERENLARDFTAIVAAAGHAGQQAALTVSARAGNASRSGRGRCRSGNLRPIEDSPLGYAIGATPRMQTVAVTKQYDAVNQWRRGQSC